MSRTTKEYRTFVKLWDDLVLAMKHNFTMLCSELFSEGLISKEEMEKSRNPVLTLDARVSKLVSLIAHKIEQDPVNYHTFVRILTKDRATFQAIFDVAGEKAKYEDEDHCTAKSTPKSGLLM